VAQNNTRNQKVSGVVVCVPFLQIFIKEPISQGITFPKSAFKVKVFCNRIAILHQSRTNASAKAPTL
jgi:hypothetical protein